METPKYMFRSPFNTDYDPITKPDCLPLSCVQRFITDATRKENPQFLVSSGSVESLDRTSNASERVEVKRKIAIKHHSYSMSSSNRSNTPTGKSQAKSLTHSCNDDELIDDIIDAKSRPLESEISLTSLVRLTRGMKMKMKTLFGDGKK